jgi:hypothetical protein
MAMGQRGQLCPQSKGVLGRFVLAQALAEQSYWSNPHDTAASFAVIAGWLPK